MELKSMREKAIAAKERAVAYAKSRKEIAQERGIQEAIALGTTGIFGYLQGSRQRQLEIKKQKETDPEKAKLIDPQKQALPRVLGIPADVAVALGGIAGSVLVPEKYSTAAGVVGAVGTGAGAFAVGSYMSIVGRNRTDAAEKQKTEGKP